MEEIKLNRRDLEGIAKMILIDLKKINDILDGVINSIKETDARTNSESN